jgi:hypothetical protein
MWIPDASARTPVEPFHRLLALVHYHPVCPADSIIDGVV